MCFFSSLVLFIVGELFLNTVKTVFTKFLAHYLKLVSLKVIHGSINIGAVDWMECFMEKVNVDEHRFIR